MDNMEKGDREQLIRLNEEVERLLKLCRAKDVRIFELCEELIQTKKQLKDANEKLHRFKRKLIAYIEDEL